VGCQAKHAAGTMLVTDRAGTNILFGSTKSRFTGRFRPG
jgi:hypothetical protein